MADLNELIEQIVGPEPTPIEVLEAYQAHPDVTNPSERLRCPHCDAPIPPNVPTREGVTYQCVQCTGTTTGQEMLDQAMAIAESEVDPQPRSPGHG